jgi:tetratricopeptide (TPR) repeat protein
MKRTLVAILTGTAAIAAAQLQAAADQPPSGKLMDVMLEARAARLKGDLQTWERAGAEAVKLAPDFADLLISLSRAKAALGQNDEALRLLNQAVERGAGLEPERFPEFERMKEEERFSRSQSERKPMPRPLPRAETFTLLPGSAEGIAMIQCRGGCLSGPKEKSSRSMPRGRSRPSLQATACARCSASRWTRSAACSGR